MKKDLAKNNTLNIVKAVRSDSDTSLREKPYARIKKNYYLYSSEINARKNLVENCEERGIWPLELLLQQFGEEKLAERIDYITDCGGRSRFDPPRTLSELRSEKYAYFAGVAAGDGGFNGPDIWSIVDGGKPEELEHSREFIETISELIQEVFGIPDKTCCIMERENRVELKIANKWFCRFLRYFFDLPESYKKGKLSRPEIFRSTDLSGAYWRGVFDTDGHIAKKSYRISMASATEKFADQCMRDLEELEVDSRKKVQQGAFHIRICKDFDQFCQEIGFSHPRKREIMLSKLKEGSRNYQYGGKRKANIRQDLFDLTKVSGLRVKGLGEIIRSVRKEKGFRQKDLAKSLGVSKNQIYYWENDKYSAPVEKLRKMFDSDITLLRLFSDRDLEYKVGKRGTESSWVNLPIEVNSKIENIASGIIVSKKELRVMNGNEKVASGIEDMFCTDITRSERKFYTKNWAVCRFFKTFFKYERKFSKRSSKELEDLQERLKII